MEKSNLKLSSESISSILTLRYNYDSKPQLPKLTWKDFQPIKKNYSADSVEENLVKSIKKSLQEDVKKISIALSAGIDSTLMLALFQKSFPQLEINAISMRFSDSMDETSYAANIAKHFGVSHEIISLDNFLVELPKSIYITKQPFWDLHWYHIVKKAKSISDYLVSGDGGDELFGGYVFRYQKYFSLISEKWNWKEKTIAYLNCHERDWVPDQEKLFGSKIGFSWEKIYQILRPYFENSLGDLEKVLLADYNGKLLFNFKPINSAFYDYFKIKSVTPLLNNDIITFASHLESRLKYNPDSGVGKIPLREILSKYVKLDLINPKKQGFSVNTVNLWRKYGFKLCEKYVVHGNISENDWISKKWVETHLKENLDDVRYVNKFLGLLAFEVWFRIFVTNEMNSETKLSV